MARPALLPAAILVPLLACGLAACALHRSPSRAPVYTVEALRTHLAEHPRAWMDRPLLVRAVPIDGSCFDWKLPVVSCRVWKPALLSTKLDAAPPLPLVLERAPALLASLRRLPLIGRLTPAPQAIRWGAAGTYRVQLHAAACDEPGTANCYAVAVLDSAP